MLQTLYSTDIPAAKKISARLTLRLALGILVATLSIFVFGGGKAEAAACTPGSGLATLTKTGVSVPSAGTYNVWVRLMAGDSAGTSVGVETTASGGTPTCYTATSTDRTNWAWKNVGTFTATASNNSLKLVGTVANVKVDRVILVSTSTACTPSDARNTSTNPVTEPGDNCLNSTTPVPPTAAVSPVLPATPPPTTPPVACSSPAAGGMATCAPSTPPPTPKPTALGPIAKPNLSLIFDWLRGSYFVQINWAAPTGSTAKTQYDVIRDNKTIGTVTALNYADYNIAAAGTYSYKLQAREGSQVTSSVVSTGTVNCFWIFCGLSQ